MRRGQFVQHQSKLIVGNTSYLPQNQIQTFYTALEEGRGSRSALSDLDLIAELFQKCL